jgi:methylenetetrahydrofolate dehydrogenase (NADP+)/methenyltetrahydrofolate cyclohydrolase
MVKIIDGNLLAQAKEAELKKKVEALRLKGKILRLVDLVMKDDEAGLLYSRLKEEAAKRIGVEFEKIVIDKPEVEGIVKLIGGYSQDDRVQGVMIQRPGVRWGKEQGMSREEFEAWWERIVGAIKLEKDVDGLRQDSKFMMATVKAVAWVLKIEGIMRGKVVVVGSQGLIGRKLVKYLSSKGFEVKGVDVDEIDLGRVTSEAEVLISATGQAGLIKEEMVKTGAVVIDVGWPQGDVELDKVNGKAKAVTPVPGGIGPLTVVSLLESLLEVGYIT